MSDAQASKEVAILREKPAIFILAFFALGILLSGNWVLPLIDRDEPRFSEASREMLQRNDFVVPHFNGDFRFDKPPLIYWCQSAAYLALGENEFAARLPSALFAVATGVLLALWGRRLGNGRAGVFAGLIFVSCLQVLVHGRLAVADMPMVFFFAAAVWSGWEMTRSSSNAGWWWMFYGSLALGFLAKGPEAWLPLAGLWIAGWRKPDLFRIRPMSMAVGILLALALVACWGAPALARTHGDFFKVGIGRHVIHRSFGVMEGHGLGGWLGYLVMLPFFFLTFFASFFPWSLWMPGALRKGAGEDLGWFLLTQSALVFAVFTIVATKLPHYTLPAFPCLALWLALRMDSRRIFFGTGISCVIMIGALFGFQWFRSNLLAANLWREAKSFVSPATQVGSVGFGEPSLVWEFRRVSTNDVKFMPLQQAARFWNEPGARCLILPTRDWDTNRIAATSNTVIVRATGLDTASFHRWDVTALIRP